MKEDLIKRINETDKPLYVRHGLGYRGATWEKTTKESLISTLQKGNYAHYDITNIYDGWGINFYSCNDMM